MCYSMSLMIMTGMTALVAILSAQAPSGPVELAYLYDLSDFTGRIPYSDARVVADPPRSEVYTLYGNKIQVFNNAGMEIYQFEVDSTEGRILDLGIESNGDMLMLIFASAGGEGTKRWSLVRADFRGRLTGEFEVDQSGAAAGLLPNRLIIRPGRTWLISQSQMRAACYLPDGKLDRILDLAELAGLAPEERGNAEVSGLDVGVDGTVVFAVPEQFRVHAIDPSGDVRSFGRVGSGGGNFGVLGDVTLDDKGNIFVSDRLRGVVMVFNRDFRLLRETGTTTGGDVLVRPGPLALDPAGRLYVSQVRDRGIAVFAIAPAP